MANVICISNCRKNSAKAIYYYSDLYPKEAKLERGLGLGLESNDTTTTDLSEMLPNRMDPIEYPTMYMALPTLRRVLLSQTKSNLKR